MATKAVNDIDILNRVGKTPLVKLESLSNDRVTFHAKHISEIVYM